MCFYTKTTAKKTTVFKANICFFRLTEIISLLKIVIYVVA